MNSASSHRRLKTAIVGFGRLGSRHAKMLIDLVPDCHLAAACTPLASEMDAARAMGIETVTDQFMTIANDPTIEAVVLVTPTSLHAEQSKILLQKGKHLLVEKPLALDYQDCLEVIKVAATVPHLVAAVGFVRRFDPHYLAAKRSLDSGRLGEAFMVRSQTADKLDPSGFFVKFSKSSGGLFMDCSIHDIDLARWYLGNAKPVRVFASGSHRIHPELAAFQDIDNGTAIIEFEGGKQAVISASRTMAHGHQTHSEVFATKGSVTIGVNAYSHDIEIWDGHGKSREIVADFYARFEAAFALELKSFVAAALGREKLSLSLSDAAEATRIGVAITQSFRSHKPIEL